MNTLKKEKTILYITLILLTLCFIIFLIFMIKGSKKTPENKLDKLIFETISTKKEVGRLNLLEDRENNIYYQISYPTIGEENVDKLINDKIKKRKKEIINSYTCDCDEVNTYYFLEYETYMGMNNTLSLILHEEIETPELKNTSNTHIYLFDISEGKELTSEDVFNGGYEKEIIERLNDTNLDSKKIYFQGNQLKVLDKDEGIPIEEMKDYLKIENKIEKNYKNDIAEPKYRIINKEQVVKENNVIYAKPNPSSEIIGTLKKDEIVKVYKNNDAGWSVLLYNNGLAYIETTKLQEKVVVPEKPNNSNNASNITQKEIVMYVTMDLNLRSEPNVKSNIVTTLTRNERVTKIDQTNNWAKVKYKDKVGYINIANLSPTMIKNRVAKENVPPQKEIDPNKPMVALTFDDGPNPTSTSRILDVMEKYNVHATFFDLGNLMMKYPDVVKREAQLGEVATHTYSHKNLNAISTKEIEKELEQSKNVFNQILGYAPALLRPPYGNANSKVKALIDMPLINWNVDSLDWKYRDKDLTLNEIDKYGNLDGKIILMHSIYKQTADAVEVLVPDLLDKGYQIVSVSELAKYRGITLEKGKIYYGFSK